MSEEKRPLTHAEQPVEEEDVHKAGILGTALNMACNIMGGAILVLPTAVQDGSIVFGVILMICLGLMSLTTMIMLVHSAERFKVYNYRALISAATKPIFGRLFEIALFLYTYGVLIEYGRVISDSMPDVARDFFHVEGGSVWTHGWIWLLLACVPFIGLTSLPRLTELKWSSFIGFATIFYIQIMILVRYFDGSYRDGRESLNAPDVTTASLSWNFFRAIPVLAVAFSCHYNIPFYYKELETRTVKQFYRVLLCVHPALITIYVLCGVLGYLTFGNNKMNHTTGNIVNAYNSGDVPINVGRLGLFFHFCSAFPIVAMGCRNCLNGILFHTPTRPQWNYIVEAICLVSTSALLAWRVPGIAFVVDIIGSLFGVAIVFIIPSIVYIGAYRARESNGLLPLPQEVASEDNSAERFMRHGDSIAVHAASSTNCSEPSESRATMSAVLPPVSDESAQPPIPKNKVLFALAHSYVVLGVAGAVISFTVTILKISKGES